MLLHKNNLINFNGLFYFFIINIFSLTFIKFFLLLNLSTYRMNLLINMLYLSLMFINFKLITLNMFNLNCLINLEFIFYERFIIINFCKVEILENWAENLSFFFFWKSINKSFFVKTFKINFKISLFCLMIFLLFYY